MDKKIGLVYFCIYNTLKSKKNGEGFLKRDDIHCLLGRLFHIPKELHSFILRELQDFGFIQKADGHHIYINSIDCLQDQIDKRILELKQM